MNPKAKALALKLLRKELKNLIECYKLDRALVSEYWDKADKKTTAGTFYFNLLNTEKQIAKETKHKLEVTRAALKEIKGM
jgi:hypothetical protein